MHERKRWLLLPTSHSHIKELRKMSNPDNSTWRGCSSGFALPVTQEDAGAARNLVNTVQRVNTVEGNPRLAEIVYRESLDFDCDIIRAVYRWDRRSYEEIFANGFRTDPAPGNSTAYNLLDFVRNAGAPLGTHGGRRYAFVSTTLSTSWTPMPNTQILPAGGQIQVYRYEIYAPGGVWVALTLGGQYQYASQAEVCFVGGIAPHYIRSAQLVTFTRPGNGPWQPRAQRDHTLVLNRYFRPSLGNERLLIQLPAFYYYDENGIQRPYRDEVYPPTPMREKREASSDDWDAALKWYGKDVADVPSYINAAFRAYSSNEAYLFMKNEYVLVNYAPGTTDDRIVNGPLLICDGFHSLIDTPFGENGIDCAFDTDYHEAFIFSANICAYIDYAPGTTDDKILSGPMTIPAMFPFFKGTVFEDGIDAAFKSTRSYEAYLFRGGQYALINYHSKHVIHIKTTGKEFPSLVGTVFEFGIDAAFASHRKNEAYLFKGEYYALINFAPGTNDDYLIGGRVKRILDNWPSLRNILPRKNYGIGVHNHHHPNDDQEQHDEL